MASTRAWVAERVAEASDSGGMLRADECWEAEACAAAAVCLFAPGLEAVEPPDNGSLAVLIAEFVALVRGVASCAWSLLEALLVKAAEDIA